MIVSRHMEILLNLSAVTNEHDLKGLRRLYIVRQIRAEKSESCAILHRSMKLCMVVEGDSKINFRSEATAKFIYFWP